MVINITQNYTDLCLIFCRIFRSGWYSWSYLMIIRHVRSVIMAWWVILYKFAFFVGGEIKLEVNLFFISSVLNLLAAWHNNVVLGFYIQCAKSQQCNSLRSHKAWCSGSCGFPDLCTWHWVGVQLNPACSYNQLTTPSLGHDQRPTVGDSRVDCTLWLAICWKKKFWGWQIILIMQCSVQLIWSDTVASLLKF